MQIERLGPYQIVGKLGRGGMGTVFEGVNLETGEPAAVKLLSAALAEEEGFRGRFEAEIETLRKLNHPNIVRLFGFGEDDARLFYAMELIDGNSLEEELGRGRRFDWREVVRIVIEICRALRHAHDRGVIHRDIKPGNLLLTADGQVKLSDFGIARLFGNTRLTSAGSVLGTAEYMAPEQAAGKPVDQRTDLYSLGAVMYVLLARRPVFRGNSLGEVLYKQQFETPEPLGRHNDDVPEELAADHNAVAGKRSCPAHSQRHYSRPMSRGHAACHALACRDPAGRRILLSRPIAPFDHPPGPDAAAVTSPASGKRPCTRCGTPGHAGIHPFIPTRRLRRPLPEPVARAARNRGHRCPAAANKCRSRHGIKIHRPFRASQPRKNSAKQEIEEPKPAIISLQTWALAAGLLLVGFTVWYFLQPPSADSLYRRIAARTEDGKIESIIQAEDEIRAYLEQYPDDATIPSDPRAAAKLRKYQHEIDLISAASAEFDQMDKGFAVTENLLPIERAYLEALGYQHFSTEQCIAKLQALVDLYQSSAETAGPTGDCLTLARRRLQQLKKNVEEIAPEQLDIIEKHLDQADTLLSTDPKRRPSHVSRGNRTLLRQTLGRRRRPPRTSRT